MNINMHRDDIHVIANALNTEAAHFDALCEDGRFTSATKAVWKEKAAQNRALSRELCNAINWALVHGSVS